MFIMRLGWVRILTARLTWASSACLDPALHSMSSSYGKTLTPHHWSQNFGKYQGRGGQTKWENLVLIAGSMNCKPEVLVVVGVDQDMEVCILQIHRRQPLPGDSTFSTEDSVSILNLGLVIRSAPGLGWDRGLRSFWVLEST